MIKRPANGPGSRVPWGLVVAGLLFGVGLRAGEAAALDGGEGYCLKSEYGELVEVSRVEGSGELVPQPFWRRRASLSIEGPDSERLSVFHSYLESEDDALSLEREDP